MILRHKLNAPWMFPYSCYYLRWCPICRRDFIFKVWPYEPDVKGHPAPEVRKWK